MRWINVDGLNDPDAIRALAIKYGLHPLAIEDLMSTGQRPKLETYTAEGGRPPYLFLIVHMIQLIDETARERTDQHVRRPQISSPSRRRPATSGIPSATRIEKPGSRLRELDASFLAYTLLDAIVDHCFPSSSTTATVSRSSKTSSSTGPTAARSTDIHEVKRRLLLLRRAVWPMREVINAMQREPHECMSDTTRTYLRDVYDHIIQIMDIIETYREVGTSLTETYMTLDVQPLSEVMKVLTIIGTIFIPLTFLAGVYGMNMPIPENH